MEPIEELGEVGMIGRQCEAAIAMLGDDVLDDRTGLGEDQLTIGDQRRGSDWMERLVLRRSKSGDGIAVVAL